MAKKVKGRRTGARTKPMYLDQPEEEEEIQTEPEDRVEELEFSGDRNLSEGLEEMSSGDGDRWDV